MDKKLFTLFEEELFEEAKRLVPIVYNEKELFYFKTEDYKKHMNEKYKLFDINIELLLVGLCALKHDGENYENNRQDIKESIDHHKRVIEYDEETFGANFDEIIDNIAKDITNNYDKYKKLSLYEVIPVLAKKYMTTHNDSVEHTAIVLYLNNALKKYGKYLSSTNLNDLENI